MISKKVHFPRRWCRCRACQPSCSFLGPGEFWVNLQPCPPSSRYCWSSTYWCKQEASLISSQSANSPFL